MKVYRRIGRPYKALDRLSGKTEIGGMGDSKITSGVDGVYLVYECGCKWFTGGHEVEAWQDDHFEVECFRHTVLALVELEKSKEDK